MKVADDKIANYSPTLDRIDSKRGYIPTNVWVICNRCNRAKGSLSPQELLQLAQAVLRKMEEVYASSR